MFAKKVFFYEVSPKMDKGQQQIISSTLPIFLIICLWAGFCDFRLDKDKYPDGYPFDADDINFPIEVKKNLENIYKVNPRKIDSISK